MLMRDGLRGARWRKSSYTSGGGTGGGAQCVELTCMPVGAVRDSKNPDGPILRADLTALVAAVKADHIG